ncbi:MULTISPECIES: type II secretion system F family protein [unclassified Helicobacter]|uniref:type II secretion system F family protein n=1 Tax=unclassified Helicobacter TaxID=2593540 RepID=UPI000CF0A0FF|nr:MULTISPECIES: type II secretion system F family protein [unclassified Helicobacter]
MKKFRVTCVKNTKVQTLSFYRRSKEDLLRELEASDIAIIEIKEISKISFKKRSFEEDFILFLKQMTMLMDSFMPIDEILQFCIQNASKNFGQVLQKILYDLRNGKKLSDGFEVFGNQISPLYKALILVGERSAKLPEIFSLIVKDLEKKIGYKKRLKKILFYPFVVFITIVLSFIGAVVFVIPEFKEFFAQNGLELPFITKSLIFLEGFIKKFGLIIVVLGSVAILFGRWLYKKNEIIKSHMDRILLEFPIFGDIALFFRYQNFLQAMYFLQSCGNDLKSSLSISIQVLDNKILEDKISRVLRDLERGSVLSLALNKEKFFDSMIIGLLQSGEKSGRLDKIFLSASKYYEEKYKDLIDRFFLYLEPLCSFMIAIFVLYLALGVFIPIWNLQDMQNF